MILIRRFLLASLALFSASSFGEIIYLKLDGSSHQVPIKIYLPENEDGSAPVVLFSHGLGGSREGSQYLAEHWAAVGYAVVMLQHPGSDASVWNDVPKWRIRSALKKAASAESFYHRIDDVSIVIDYLEEVTASKKSDFYHKLDMERIAMVGHSFGAVTAQALMGQSFIEPGESRFHDSRIDCFILMSPSQSKLMSNSIAFGHIDEPVLAMTGTQDNSPLRKEVTPESRKNVYGALPAGNAYQIVFHEGKHSIFGDYRRNDPRYHVAILEITTNFLEAYLKNDVNAVAWLRSENARNSLIPEDTWEWK
ncbi:MAG: alpha/beta fold hydrolase [Verrucomicrobiota bacterium]